jgi:hypothetical protein
MGFRRAVQEALCRWGGMTEPVIPVKSDGQCEPWWHQAVDLARVDQVINVDVPDADAANRAAQATSGLGRLFSVAAA